MRPLHVYRSTVRALLDLIDEAHGSEPVNISRYGQIEANVRDLEAFIDALEALRPDDKEAMREIIRKGRS